MRNVTRGGALLFVCLWLVGCRPAVVTLESRARSFTPDDYPAVYERWTRGARPFDFGQLQNVLNVTATFESREFRWAYVVRYAHDFALATEARNAMLAASMADAELYHRFFVTMGDGRPRDFDLTSDEGSWRILLIDDRGRQVRPISVDLVDTLPGGGVLERAYFPSMSPFRRAFRVVFPVRHEDGLPTIPKEALFLVLRLTGPKGQVDLKWHFTPP